MNLMKEVKKDRDGIRKELEKCKRGEAVSTAQRQFTVEQYSGTHIGSNEGLNDPWRLGLPAASVCFSLEGPDPTASLSFQDVAVGLPFLVHQAVAVILQGSSTELHELVIKDRLIRRAIGFR
ncbi:hypothetical protein LR48_Vigan08g087400 [Vigna angularis]|uniref:Uncharacterized protein n=1 Tax=Phaseolus angularis TaxID=3914 RepID=A0A0L9V531_PHAAN|nr:hypothetical protein LR48_Vigan08g087400 [Vigna angularis]